ncbi:MAG: Cytochrome bd oxidase subunit [Myxococcaceae bacterium]|nr:Cytochrome bd oxidase subunit [Myxococcaceae bacterium]
MGDLLAARSQMAMSLGFHILFAVAGMAMPLLMVIAQWRHQRTGEPVFLELAHRWAKGTAILFAVGAVSGTVLSFELGLLWPRFMQYAGPLIGMPFSLEGFAFFLEAIFLGLYLYGWKRLSPRVHLLCGVGVAICGLASGVFVVAVNAFMNTPGGLVLEGGKVVEFDPWIAFFSASFPTQAAHTALSAYSAVSFAVLGIHAWRLRVDPHSAFHQRALEIALAMAIVSTPLQIFSGDRSAKHLAEHQPVKLAAAEAVFQTTRRAGLSLGGWPDEEARKLRYALEIPAALSILGKGSPDAEIAGLDQVPRGDWPPIAVVHLAFQLMVGCGMAMLGVCALGGLLWWRKRQFDRRFLGLAMASGPLGLIAIEAGWTVTEVGRQPWVLRGLMRTADAVTPMPGLIVPFTAFTVLYLILGLVVVVLLRAHVFDVPKSRP